MSEDCCLCVSSIGVNKHAGDNTVPVKGLSVRKMGVGEARIGRCIIPAGGLYRYKREWKDSHQPPIVKALLARSSRSSG